MSVKSYVDEVIDQPPGVEVPPSTRPAPANASTARRWAQELALVAVFVFVYEWLRHGMIQSGAEATAHALSIVRIESDLGLFHEQAIQSWFLHFPDIVRGFNLYYGGTHFVVPVVALLWLALRHPERYGRARNLLGVTTGVAFVIFWRFPVAPPRLLPSKYGIIDTLVTMGNSGRAESRLIDSAGDVYAAMPSLHVAWAIWCTIVLYPVVQSRVVRVLLIAYPVVTTVVWW
jgi:hypothetical protein